MKNFHILKNKVPLPIVGLLIPVALGMGYLAHGDDAVSQGPQSDCVQSMEQIRQRNFEFARPLLLANVSMEDSRLGPLKSSLSAYIDSRTREGILQSASVYIRILNKGAWIAVNEDERYSPGSLLKVPLMIYCLKESQIDPAFLGKKLRFDGHHDTRRLPSIICEQLTAGEVYTVNELIRRMIMFSDNDATVLLDGLAHTGDIQVYADLDLPKPDPKVPDYLVTADEYSRFFRVLFNATYLSAPMSDYALKMMAQSSFDDGITRPFGKGVLVPRKFGEREVAGVKQFHEFGIVYLGNEPYLLGVMTKGRDMNELTNVASDISEIVYNTLKHAKQNS